MAANDWVKLFNDDPRGTAAAGLTVNTFTTAADTTKLFPNLVFPQNYFQTGRVIQYQARGTYGTTGSPTYTFTLQFRVGTVVTLVTSAAITAGTTQTNMPWCLTFDIKCVTEGVTGTLQAQGDGYFGLTTTTQSNFFIPAAGTALATATVDTTIAQTLNLEVACSASSASNTVTGQVLKVLSIN